MIPDKTAAKEAPWAEETPDERRQLNQLVFGMDMKPSSRLYLLTLAFRNLAIGLTFILDQKSLRHALVYQYLLNGTGYGVGTAMLVLGVAALGVAARPRHGVRWVFIASAGLSMYIGAAMTSSWITNRSVVAPVGAILFVSIALQNLWVSSSYV